jgi:hypothetical protein
MPWRLLRAIDHTFMSKAGAGLSRTLHPELSLQGFRLLGRERPMPPS